MSRQADNCVSKQTIPFVNSRQCLWADNFKQAIVLVQQTTVFVNRRLCLRGDGWADDNVFEQTIVFVSRLLHLCVAESVCEQTTAALQTAVLVQQATPFVNRWLFASRQLRFWADDSVEQTTVFVHQMNIHQALLQAATQEYKNSLYMYSLNTYT